MTESPAEGSASQPAPAPAAPPRPRIVLVVVDGSEEMPVALTYAARIAARDHARVGLLHVIPPPETGSWMMVESLMRTESRAQAEALVQTHADRVLTLSGQLPVMFIREGQPQEEVAALLGEDRGIVAVVLAAARSSDNPGPLIRFLTGKGLGRLKVPLVIVPASLTEADAELLASP